MYCFTISTHIKAPDRMEGEECKIDVAECEEQ